MSTLTRSAAGTPYRQRSRLIIGALAGYLAVAAVLWTIAATSTRRLAMPPLPRGLGWLDGWVRYDSGWYHLIATSGYSYTPGQQSSVAFFPAYPLAMRGLGSVVGNVYLAGVALTVVSGLVIAVLFARWSAQRLPRPVAAAAVALLLLYPYSLYLYGAVYADALFVAATIGAFLLLEGNRPLLAGVVGALATASRPTGLALLVGLTVRAVELAGQRRAVVRAERLSGARSRLSLAWSQAGEALRAVRWRDAAVLVCAVGVASYCVFQWMRFGTPFAFVETESAPGWDQGTGPRVWFKVSFVHELILSRPLGKLRLLAAASVCLVVALLVWRVRRRFGWGYAAFTAAVVAIPALTTKDFMGSGRYLLVAFPAFAAGADFLTERPRWLLRTLLVIFAFGLAFFMFLYTRDYEVS